MKLLDIIYEQSSKPLISDKGYNAILKFENTKGTPNDKMTGAKSMGYDISKVKSLEGIISLHINSTIGLRQWFKIPDLFRTQIYSFMFNSDSKNNDLFRWLSGLAQSIDSSIDRSTITGKNINDQNVQDAIKLINDTINDGKIGSYYNQYLKVLDNQYKSIMGSNTQKDSNGNVSVKPWFKASYDYSWSVRPKEIEDYYNNPDEDVEPVKKVVTPEKKVVTPDNKPTDSKDLIIKGTDVTDLFDKVRVATLGKTLDLKSIKVDTNNLSLKVTETPTGTKVKKLAFVFGLPNEPCESCGAILTKNPGSKVVTWGKLKDNSEYNVIALF